MRWLILRGFWILAAGSWLAGKADAATLTGRVVDSAGQPIAGAEVRIWQKLPVPDGRGLADLSVNFDEGDVLHTDADGRFTTPDVLVGEAFAQVVVEAKGRMASRSGWIEIGKDATAAPDLILKKLRAVIGQVLDREGRPVAGATVFNSGDGHQRVETKTGRTGKFFLDGVPEGVVFLFAEKPGYRFTGMRLPAGRSDAAFTLTAVNEPAEPLTTLPPLLSPDDETALARAVLDPWLEETLKSGTEMQKRFVIAALSHIDPLAALKQFDSLAIQNPQSHAVSRHGLVDLVIARSGQLSSDAISRLIDSTGDELSKTYQSILAARQTDANDRPRQLEWLDRALLHARRIDNAAQRIQSLASVADAWFSHDERERAATVLAEAEKLAAELPETVDSAQAFGFLALAVAHCDAGRAVEWLEKIKGDRDYHQRGGQLALRQLPERPEMAEEVWARAMARGRPPEPRRVALLPSVYLADFCYRLTAVDRVRAERVASADESVESRVRGQGAIVLALAETQPAEARGRLESLVRDELPLLTMKEGTWFRARSPPATAAWLLPIAERVAPDLCGEIFWRSLALRLPRPRRDHFDDDVETTDIELVKMLARYDRSIARALLESFAVRLLQPSSLTATALASQPALMTAAAAAQPIRDVVVAAVHVDPHWARKLLDLVPAGAAASKVYALDGARQAFVMTILRHGPDRWNDWDARCAAFWKPNFDER